MKVLSVTLISLFIPFFVDAHSTPPAWNRVEGKGIGFFREKGFDFSIDDSMAQHYEKPTVEISISIPVRFRDAELTNELDAVSFLNEEMSTEIATHQYEGKKRIILTVSEAIARKSEIFFYFRNRAKNVTDGSMYILRLDGVLEDWKRNREKKPNKSVAPNDGSATHSKQQGARLSPAEAIRIAKQAAECKGVTLGNYKEPAARYYPASEDRYWRVYFEGKVPRPGNFFSVSITDTTGEARFLGGK